MFLCQGNARSSLARFLPFSKLRVYPFSHNVPRGLTIAGLDPCSFAGCTADLRTFRSLGVHGFSATTALTVQSPGAFLRCDPVDHTLVSDQIRVVFESFGPIPTKIGLVPTVECMDSIAECLPFLDGQTVVVDPVGASSAAPDDSFNKPLVLAEKLFPLASIVTPNIPEAEALLDCRIRSVDDLVSAATEIHSRYGCWVLLKGGHLPDDEDSTDVLFTGKDSLLLPAPRASVSSIHGSGCFLSASITAFSALGFDLMTAVRMAKDHVSKAFSDPVDVGVFPLLYSRP